MTLHLIADDLAGHSWYEELFIRTISEIEAYAARWAAFEELVSSVGEEPPEPV